MFPKLPDLLRVWLQAMKAAGASKSMKVMKRGAALQAIEHLLEEGQCKAAYETWCSAAEATLAEGCRNEGELVSCRHFGRSKVPQLRTCAALQRAGVNVEGDVTVRRLEKARSGLTDLTCRWAHRLHEGTASHIWANACRRIALVSPQWGNQLPQVLPAHAEVDQWLSWVSQEIACLQNQARQQALSTWQRRMQISQSARLRWAKARYTRYESVPNNAAAFRSVEAVWRPILRNSKVPSSNSHPSTHPGAGFPSVSAEDFLDLSGADLRAAVARSPAYTSSGADGWARSDLLALPQSFWRPLSLILRGMALQGDFHKALQTVVTTLIPKKREASFLEDATCLRPISVTSLIYRCWVGALAKRIAMVLEASLPEEAFGFRSCTSAQIPMAAALLRSQTAAVRDQAQYFVNYDIQKCFDSVPWDYAAASLAACGVPQGVVAALKATWAGWRRVWCLQGGQEIARSTTLETLGACFHVGAGEARLGSCQVKWNCRAQDIGALMGGISYAAVSWDARHAASSKDLRLVVNSLAGGRLNKRRCQEVALGLLAPVHRVSIPHAIIHEQLATLIRVLNHSHKLRSAVQEHFQACAGSLPPGSFCAAFTGALATLGWEWKEWHTVTDHTGRDWSLLCEQTLQDRRTQWRETILASQQRGHAGLNLLVHAQHDLLTMFGEFRQSSKHCSDRLLHHLRDRMRHQLLSEASARRRDMRQLEQVDRKLLAVTQQNLDAIDQPLALFLQQGAALTAARLHRSSRGRQSAECPFCRNAEESECHRYWECSAWDALRREVLGEGWEELAAMMRDMANVATTCAVPVHSMPPSVRQHWHALVNCVLRIHRAATDGEAHS